MKATGELAGTIRLHKQVSRRPPRYARGAPWIYSNEIEGATEKLAPGSWVAVENAEGRILGTGFYNPHSLIAFRWFHAGPDFNRRLFDTEVRRRLDTALELRRNAFAAHVKTGEMGSHSFRLVFGESDGLPGLIVDLFESNLGKPVGVVQCHAAGADAFLNTLWAWMLEKLQAQALIVRNDIDVRERERATLFTETMGVLPERTFAREGYVDFEVSPLRGQKTGYFYDLRAHRRRFTQMMEYRQGMLLDAFCFIGSWGLQALKRNPRLELVAADVSGPALDLLEANAEANGLKERVRTFECDLLKEEFAFERSSFDGVVCDPPSLTHSAKHLEQGARAHAQLFKRATAIAEEGAPIAFASCSFHLGMEGFLDCVSQASHGARKSLVLTSVGYQDDDHPALAALPESRYLKCAMGYVREPLLSLAKE